MSVLGGGAGGGREWGGCEGGGREGGSDCDEGQGAVCVCGNHWLLVAVEVDLQNKEISRHLHDREIVSKSLTGIQIHTYLHQLLILYECPHTCSYISELPRCL